MSLTSTPKVHGTKGTVIMNGEYDKIIFWDLEDDEEKIDLFPTIGVTDGAPLAIFQNS